MKPTELRANSKKSDKQLLEDMKNLQQKIPGRGVYRNSHVLNSRQLMHRNAHYQYQD